MSGERILPPFAPNTALDTSSLSSQSSSLPLWDRLSSWAAENKAAVYTIAGIAILVTGAGIVYYRSDSRTGGASGAEADAKKKASKKERRKAKKDKDKDQTQPESKNVPEGQQQG